MKDGIDNTVRIYCATITPELQKRNTTDALTAKSKKASPPTKPDDFSSVDDNQHIVNKFFFFYNIDRKEAKYMVRWYAYPFNHDIGDPAHHLSQHFIVGF